MHRHCGTNNRAPRWTFMDPIKPEVRPGAREESASPAWLSAPAMNARDNKNVYILTLEADRHYIGSVTVSTHLSYTRQISVFCPGIPTTLLWYRTSSSIYLYLVSSLVHIIHKALHSDLLRGERVLIPVPSDC